MVAKFSTGLSRHFHAVCTAITSDHEHALDDVGPTARKLRGMWKVRSYGAAAENKKVEEVFKHQTLHTHGCVSVIRLHDLGLPEVLCGLGFVLSRNELADSRCTGEDLPVVTCRVIGCHRYSTWGC